MKKITSLILFLCVWLSGCAVNPVEYPQGTTTAIWKSPTNQDFMELKNAGIGYIEVAMNQCWRGVPSEEVMSRIQHMKEMIDSAELRVWSVHLPFSRTLDISVLDDSARKANVELIASMIDASAIFKPSRLVLHPSSEPIADTIREQRIEHARASIGMLKQYATAIGAVLCMENLPRTCLGNTPEELMRIIAGHPEVGICFDTNHYFHGTTEHFMNVAGERIKTIHASDYNFTDESHWLPGQGDIDWGQFVELLHRVGYRGVFMYEATKNREDTSRITPDQLTESYSVVMNTYESLK